MAPTIDSAAIKPCPFCGATWGAGLTLGYRGQPATAFFVHCSPCNADGPVIESLQAEAGWPAAAEAWNVRSVIEEAKDA